MSLTYQTPTLLTRAHFYGADPAVAASTGNNFSANYDDHSWNYDVEHISGLTIRVDRRLCFVLPHHVSVPAKLCLCEHHAFAPALIPALQGHRTYQTNHLIYPTDVVYPNVWMKAPGRCMSVRTTRSTLAYIGHMLCSP
jgi:hypothetical protein